MPNEKDFGKGAVKSPLDLRDRKLEKIASAPLPFDWEKGYSVEKELGEKLGIKDFKLPIKDQNGSSSCGGQAVAYYEAVQDAFEKGVFTDKSAKDIYSQCFVPGGGSAGRTLMDLVSKKGVCLETLIPSLDKGHPPTESFMEQKLQDTGTRTNALTAKCCSYARVNLGLESLAIAVRDNHGVLLGVDGSNNGSWLSKFPVPPQTTEWRHWLFLSGAKMVLGEKRLEIINSWGLQAGDRGHQWLGENYVPHFFEAWSLYDDGGVTWTPTFQDQIRAILQKIINALRK